MNSKKEIIWKGTIVACLKVLSIYLIRENEENNENLS
jgi:hypothetical protein